jgi:flavin reductase (DIM6/NTAB) family NADH-FMN oxidoreductase RutF
MEPYVARAFASLTTGIYVLTVIEDGHPHGMSSSWVIPVSGNPPLLAVAVDCRHQSRAVIERTGVFGLNVLSHRCRTLEDYFNSPQARRADNLDEIAHEPSPELRVPWITGVMISIEAKVEKSYVAGDHTIFIASPVGVKIGQNDQPMSSLDLEYVYVGGDQVIPRPHRE